MRKYHVNPITGNSAICNSSVKPCPFGLLGDPHFSTKTEASEYFEKRIESNQSRGAELILRLVSIDEESIYKTSLLRDYPTQGKERDALKLRIEELNTQKNKIENYLKNLGDDEIDLNSSIPQKNQAVQVNSHEDVRTEEDGTLTYTGFSVGFFNLIETKPEILREAQKASKAWLAQLTNKEVKAIYTYSFHHDSYSIVGKKDNEHYPHMESALKKATNFKKPLKLYAGLSMGMSTYFNGAKEGEVVSIDRGFSTSLNPAQMNVFVDPRVNTGIVVTAKRGGSMAAASEYPSELEFILESGDYRIVKIEKNPKVRHGTGINALQYAEIIHIEQL